ncbi:helix-turn-helix domain-containing protein [Corynebacterium sanguinis]|uniref:helix-turn-helix domain-containing protein n=1 Tax=Corynebacterium sanguinis TaxID=2594913 RepID=UPI0021A7BD92|nr:helix-turn-helix domain-containing protein [Corynebacterium sanguinis]MCT1491334.1 helix-turn-helix domain-containing protein [Corynebacterium sanguinis]MCT2246747.1 helix-turn-helix domain-containing protein [Corynebacterium sanguinis]
MTIQTYDHETGQWVTNPHVIDVDDAARLVGIHPDTIRAAVKRGESIGFPVIRAGRRYVVPVRPLLAVLGLDELPKK